MPRNRYEPGLFALPPSQVFERAYDPVMAGGELSGPPIKGAYSRFQISHIGMSAFGRFDILLLTDEHGAERCLWREAGNKEIHDCRLWRREMERVAEDACILLEQELGP